jgi:hypothetical protein
MTVNIIGHQQKLQRFEQIRASGIPINENALNKLRSACGALELFPSPNVCDNSIYDENVGETVFTLGVYIHNNSEQIIRLAACRIRAPWADTDFRWLEHPWRKVPREYSYSHRVMGPAGFDPEVVLNHRFGRSGRLYPDDCWDGLLIGVGRAAIPVDYRERQAVKVQLLIYEGNGTCHKVDVKLGVRRSEKSRQEYQKWLEASSLGQSETDNRGKRVRSKQTGRIESLVTV